MHEYDIALKSILTRGKGRFLAGLTGLEVARWRNTELPEVRSRRADLLGRTADGTLIHIELQSTHDPRMAFRMLEYSLAIHAALGRFPRQVVLYVGEASLRMAARIAAPDLAFECRIVDIRELDSEPLLESGSLEDNVIGILARLADERQAIRRILEKIAASDPPARAEAISSLTILAGLRRLGPIIEKEIERMPILDDIMDHDLLGPAIRSGIDIGRVEGRVEGERALILSQIGKRFGAVPVSVRQRIESLAAPELEQLALRLLDARTLEDL